MFYSPPQPVPGTSYFCNDSNPHPFFPSLIRIQRGPQINNKIKTNRITENNKQKKRAKEKPQNTCRHRDAHTQHSNPRKTQKSKP